MRLLRNIVVGALDRPGGRTVLGALTTLYARWVTGRLDVACFYDGIWAHRVGQRYVVDRPRYAYFSDVIRNWPGNNEKVQSDVRDIWFIVYRPSPGEVIVDVGAGVGNEVYVFSQAVGPLGRVYAIEAHPGTYRRLAKMCELNRLENVVPCHCAIAGEPGKVYIEDRWHHTRNAIFAERGCGQVSGQVRALSLDKFCQECEIERIDFLKMNIEGAEKPALRGMSDVIGRTHHVCIACHDFRADAGDGEEFRTRVAVTDFLIRHGFTIHVHGGGTPAYLRDHVHGVRS